MTDIEAEREFVETLPGLQANDTFCFRCDPTLACFNRCCSDLHLELTPYDALRLGRALKIPGRRLLLEYCEVGRDPENGFPVVMLRMREDQERTCPFVRDSGCKIYSDRPGACRSYPVGRGAGLLGGGEITEQFVLVREEHCQGLEDGPAWTAHEWMKDQGMEQYIRYNDRYMSLLSGWRDSGRKLDERRAQAVLLALYDCDDMDEALRMERLRKIVEG